MKIWLTTWPMQPVLGFEKAKGCLAREQLLKLSQVVLYNRLLYSWWQFIGRGLQFTQKLAFVKFAFVSNDLVKNSYLRKSKKLRRASLVFQENIVLNSNILNNIVNDTSIYNPQYIPSLWLARRRSKTRLHLSRIRLSHGIVSLPFFHNPTPMSPGISQ